MLGEHRELHALWSIIINNKKAYSNHPETLRWKGKLKALYLRHEEQVQEMRKRGYNHDSPLDKNYAKGKKIQADFVVAIKKQKKNIKQKNCQCRI